MDDLNNELELSDTQPESPEPAAEPPAPEPAPEPMPEPVAEREPEPEPEPEKTSLLKKEISFKRKPKPVDEWDDADPEEKPEKTSFLKKEISFKRKAKPEPGAEPVVDDGDEAETSSFLKKEISFKRKRKPKPVDEWDDVDPEDETPDKTPFYKKDLSFKRRPKPELDEPVAEPRPRKKRTRSSRQNAGHKRQKRVVGLKIGGSQLAAARIVNNGHPELVQYAREDLEQTVVVAGELREPELLAEALRAFFKKHKLPRTGIRLGIANNRIGVRIFEIAGITDPRQLENAVRFRAQEVLPIPLEEAVMDYHVLGERVDEDGTPLTRILLVVAYRKLIDRYVEACRKAGLRLSGIDLEAFALLRALAEPRDEEDGAADAAAVVVAIGHDRSTFAVSDGRVCEFTRVLDWGGGILNVVIARELDVSPSEAIDIKHELSLVDDAVPDGLTPEQAQRVRDAVRRQLQTFARELVSSLQFYQNQPGSLGIGEIVITGGTAHLTGLAQELNRLIGVRVTVGDPLARVKVGRKVGEEEQLGSLSIAIGLGIED